jgi:hypothetical protein
MGHFMASGMEHLLPEAKGFMASGMEHLLPEAKGFMASGMEHLPFRRNGGLHGIRHGAPSFP